MPLLMVSMDAEQGTIYFNLSEDSHLSYVGLSLVHVIHPDITIPIHYDDYDVFKSPLKVSSSLVPHFVLKVPHMTVQFFRISKTLLKRQD